MRAILDRLFGRLIRLGSLRVTWPGGDMTRYGPGIGPTAAIVIHDRRAVRRLTLNPGLAVGECYMDGSLTLDGCAIRDLLVVLISNLSGEGRHVAETVHARTRMIVRRLAQLNTQRRSRRNVAHHYDLNSSLYRLFLDEDMQYSCAYFTPGTDTLEDAQAAKKRHIAAKLLLNRPNLRVLDIGCGWGGLAITLARDFDAEVTGITLSAEQLAVAQARAEAAGVARRVTFKLLDYRAVQGQFDRMVSVGMFEHVGVTYYAEFFAVLRRCLTADGVALLHAIGCSGPPSTTNPWITKYIFPGGYSPSLSEVMPHAERSGLIVTDIEILRLHYAKTLAAWQERFAANRTNVAAMYDERFCRMFEFYLAGAELAFRYQREMVWQMQLTRSLDAVPLTRTYMVEDENDNENGASAPVWHVGADHGLNSIGAGLRMPE